jgi:hypothetical protein
MQMAAYLSRSGADGKPFGNPGLPVNETLTCTIGACPISYVLSYGQAENRMVGNENNLDIMRNKAKELIAKRHPHPSFDDAYVWGGPEKGWLDKEAANAAGI